MSKVPEPVDVFISYAHTDEAFRDRLEKHLASLKREGFINVWHDRRIVAGDDWTSAISENLEASRLVILLISPDFLASSYCFDIETTRAVQRYFAGEAVVVPVILKAVDWKNAPVGGQRTPLKTFQALPAGARPITNWPDQDDAFYSVAQGLRTQITELHAKSEAQLDPTADQQTAPGSRVASATVDVQFRKFTPTSLRNRLIALAALVTLLGAIAGTWIYMGAGGRFARVKEVGPQATGSVDSDPFGEAATSGNDLFDQNRFADAVVAYTEALRINPESRAAYMSRGASHLHQKQYPQALEDLTDAVRLNPQHPESHVLRGFALLGAGRRPEAVGEFRQASALDPTGPFGTCSLAAALWLERKAPTTGNPIDGCSNVGFRQLLAQVTGGESPW